MANITNNYAPGSCNFEAGSSQNGDITINGPIYQGGAKPDKNGSKLDSQDIGSPLHLAKIIGIKIDLIRVMNAWYECGRVTDANGGKLTKKEFFTWVGRLFNIDLSNYDKDLSNSMASNVSFNKQSRIFDELKEKQEQIFNSK